MKCERCGAILQENAIRCNYCGHVLQMVPDYNPLEEVIQDEVRSAINTDIEQHTENLEYTSRMLRMDYNTSELDREKNRQNARNPRDTRTNASGNKREVAKSNNTRDDRQLELKRRKEIARRRALKKKKRNVLIGCMCFAFFSIVLLIYLIYNSSYAGQMSKANDALLDKDYSSAIYYYNKAIDKDESKTEAYYKLASVYEIQENWDDAESVLLDALEYNESDLDLNVTLIELYLSTDQTDKINDYIASITDEELKSELQHYESLAPELSLESGTYDDVQELTIISDEKYIYYTLDGSEATEQSELYEEAIQLGEGTTVVRAISVNSEGVPSDEVEQEYIIELPMETAPVVTPSTGQYTEETKITVQVPQGYTAFYTTDNTTPDITSEVYVEPIDMPEGNTIFTVVLVNTNGRYSDVTKRNYDLVLKDEDEE